MAQIILAVYFFLNSRSDIYTKFLHAFITHKIDALYTSIHGQSSRKFNERLTGSFMLQCSVTCELRHVRFHVT